MSGSTSNRLEMHPKYIVAGPLQREFVVLADGKCRLDFLGGSGIYAAAGLGLWDGPVGLLCRVGEDYPREWLDEFKNYNLDARGVHINKELIDLRSFTGYKEPQIFENHSPVGHFARHNLPYPTILLNYKSSGDFKDDLKTLLPTSPRSMDIPQEYLDATAIHLCPMDYLTHNLLQPALRSGASKTITVEASSAYLLPEYWDKLPAIVSGLTAFIVKESALRLFFRNRSDDVVEMAETITNLGCEMVIVMLSDGNKVMVEYTRSNKWLIPAYPVEKINYHQSGSAFGGGLLAGYQISYDPVQAVLHGEISQSMASEGLHPFFLFDALPGLAAARLDVLKEMVRKI
jgi:hypothetical protein